MDIRRLEAFSKVYEMRSFSRAAQELYLSQPSVSAHILSLEDELGVRLFDRLGRKILPTQAGDVLYGNALELFEVLVRARSGIDELRDKVAGKLVIGGSTIPANYMLPAIMADFAKKHSEVEISLNVGDSEVIVERVVHGQLVLGVVGAEVRRADITCEPLAHDRLVVIAPRDFPLLDLGTITHKQMASWPWVMRERGSGTRKAFELGLSGIGLSSKDLKVSVHVENTGATLECVRHGLGVAVTSRLAARDLLDRGEIQVIEGLSLDMERDFYLIHHSGRQLLPVVHRFMDHLKQNCPSL